ncbi:LysR substrate-binding domain-containing protein [Novosphingobium terrae]|uniref:LysR substrate-binding domain-containing protein n=1 Tax=Novosphingobium terrae TaxID=2726189 RepID=UPI0019809B8D|nr:LysR substrate-binding domain-containing protein [Novosphingobium terrae]
MTLNQIRNVVAIAERGSLRSAARFLGVTQPSITRSIRELEHELGVTLFERKATGMALTEMGKAVVRRGTAIQHEMRRVQTEIEQLKGHRVGNITIGLSTVSHIALLPRVIGTFEKRFPHVRLRIVEGLFPTMERELQDGVMDFYVGPLAHDSHPPEMTVEPLFANSRMVFARKGHPLAGARSIHDLTGARWVVDALTLIGGDEMAGLFARHGAPAPDIAVSGQTSLSTVMALVGSDLLAALPQQWAPILQNTGQIIQIPIREPLAAATICMVSRASLPLTPVAEHLADLFRRAAIHHARTLPGSMVLTA